MGYLQYKLSVAFCVNVLVRPTRISPRQSGAARPCSTPPALRGVQGKTFCLGKSSRAGHLDASGDRPGESIGRVSETNETIPYLIDASKPRCRGALDGSRATRLISKIRYRLVRFYTVRILSPLSLSLSLIFITRVAPHCVNTLMILHAAHTLMTSAG